MTTAYAARRRWIEHRHTCRECQDFPDHVHMCCQARRLVAQVRATLDLTMES
jgi:hypothetical protein